MAVSPQEMMLDIVKLSVVDHTAGCRLRKDYLLSTVGQPIKQQRRHVLAKPQPQQRYIDITLSRVFRLACIALS